MILFSRSVPALLGLALSLPAWGLGSAGDLGLVVEARGAAQARTLTLVATPAVADLGQTADWYIAAEWSGLWFCFTGQSWQPCPATLPSARSGALAQTRFNLGTIDSQALRGLNIYAGYGSSAAELLQSQRYRHVYRVGQASAIQWSDAQTVASGANIRLAFNNTAVAVRDASGTLHVVWDDNTAGYHGRYRNGAWSVATLPKQGSGTYAKATLGLLPDGELLLAWNETTSGAQTVLATRSRDGASRWDRILTVASGNFDAPVALHTFRRADGRAGASIGWHDNTSRQVKITTWRGNTWATSDWTTAVSPASGTGTAHDLALGGLDDTVYATWEDDRSGQNEVYLAKSSDGGLTWGSDRALGLASGSPRGQDPSLVVGPDGRVVIGYQNQNQVFLTHSSDGGNRFSAATPLGNGLFVHVAGNSRGTFASTWEFFSGSGAFNDAGKSVGNALSLDDLGTLSAPHSMPGSSTTLGSIQGAVTVSDGQIDVFWVDTTTSGSRALKWRSGRLD